MLAAKEARLDEEIDRTLELLPETRYNNFPASPDHQIYAGQRTEFWQQNMEYTVDLDPKIVANFVNDHVSCIFLSLFLKPNFIHTEVLLQ